MDIIEIAKEIENKKTNSIDADMLWKPLECENYSLPQFIIPASRKKAVTRIYFSKVLAFIDLVKYKRLAHGCTIMPIATTNKRLISICGSQRNVSNFLVFMKNVGLIADENGNYQYNASMEGYNKSKTYRYYYENEEKVKEYCELKKINRFVIKNNIRDTVVERLRIDSFSEEQVRFSSKLHLLKPDNYSCPQFEEYITMLLYKNYPQLEHYQTLADTINEKYYPDASEMAVNFRPTFTWSKGNKAIRKIGIRATNALVSAKKDKDGNENFKGFYKEDILERYGFNLEKDVKSSVPRLTLSLNVGGWIPESVDMYEMIYDSYVCKKCEEEKIQDIHTVVQRFADVREAVKSLHMRGYFDKENTLGVHVRRVMKTVSDKDAVDKEMKIYQQAVTEAEGGTLYDSEIFFHESCIYMDVLKQLLDEGYKVWQCYDSWYSKKRGITQEQYEKYVEKIVEEKANNYIYTYSSTKIQNI